MKEAVTYIVLTAIGLSLLALILVRIFFFSTQSEKIMKDGLNEGAEAIAYYKDDFKYLAGQTVDGTVLIDTLRAAEKEIPNDIKARNYYKIKSDGTYESLRDTVTLPEIDSNLQEVHINSDTPEEALTIIPAENSFMLPRPSTQIEIGKTYNYKEIHDLIASSNFAVTYTIEGPFGTFSCKGGNTIALDTFYRILQFSQLTKGFIPDETASDQSTQAYLRVDDTLVTSTDILEYYCGHLVYGYNLSRAIDAADVCTYDVRGDSGYVQGDALDKTSLYCVYKGEKGYLIENSGVYTGATLAGNIWNAWLAANNNAWTYNLELNDETYYTFTGCIFDPLGVVTQISLELK